VVTLVRPPRELLGRQNVWVHLAAEFRFEARQPLAKLASASWFTSRVYTTRLSGHTTQFIRPRFSILRTRIVSLSSPQNEA
jgi:hypothetical protein